MINPPDDVNADFVDSGANDRSNPGRWRMEQAPVETISIKSLHASQSPRLSGESLDHVHALAEADGQLPPIIVHRPTMRVIDGRHRLLAAQQCDRDEIEVRFFDGSETEAFVLAVHANIAHGLPLSTADRKAAALRIIVANPYWSDRMIATRTGLAAKTVAALRGGPDERPDSRIGQDGRLRPVNSTAGRELAGELIAGNPDLSLRQVARAAGISPETVRDVRGRLRRGEDPARTRRSDPPDEDEAPPPRERAAPDAPQPPTGELQSVLRQLKSDPSLRLNATGRVLLKILNANTVINSKFGNIVDNVPEHCRAAVAQAARECAHAWGFFATQLEPPAP